jgi:hypothetical protein
LFARCMSMKGPFFSERAMVLLDQPFAPRRLMIMPSVRLL